MAIIFFEGFNDNREVNRGFWYPLPTATSTATNQPRTSWGATGTIPNQRGAQQNQGSLVVYNYNTNDTGALSLNCDYGTQEAPVNGTRKIFFGFAIHNLHTDWWGLDSSGNDVNGNSASATDLLSPFCEINAITGTALTFSFGRDSASASEQYLIQVDGTGNAQAPQFVVPADYFEAASLPSRQRTAGGGGDQTVQNRYVAEQWVYIEIAVTLSDTGSPDPSTVEMRFQDQNLIAKGASNVVDLATKRSTLETLKIILSQTYTTYFDDLYIADNTGAIANNFLGQEVKIYSPNISVLAADPGGAEGKQDWDVVPTGGDPTLNIVDNTNYITTSVQNSTSSYRVTNPITLDTDAIIGAVMLTSWGRKTSLDARYEHVYNLAADLSDVHYSVEEDPANNYNFSKFLTNLSFDCSAVAGICDKPYTTIMTQRPDTATSATGGWAISEINEAWFGVRALTPGTTTDGRWVIS